MHIRAIFGTIKLYNIYGGQNIYDPIDCGHEQKIKDIDKQEFYNFIDALTNDEIKKDNLPSLFSRCIDKINSKKLLIV